MNHEELIEYGCDYCIAEDQYGETKSGYWMPGEDPNHKVFGIFLGETPEIATEAIRG